MSETDTLYHYTSGHSLIQITSSRILWATRMQYLNDASELRAAMRLAATVCDELSHRFPEGFGTLGRYLQSTQHSAWIFVTSLTEQGDQLSQWRAYGTPGDSYSIGFRRELLQEAADSNGWRLERCVYDQEEQRHLLRENLLAFIAHWENGDYEAHLTDNEPVDQTFMRYGHSHLLSDAPRCKEESFAEEAEWRLISPVTSLDVKFRPGRQSIIPYIELQLGLDGSLANDLVVGPGGTDQLAALDAVASLGQANNFAIRQAQLSRSSYRSF